MSQDVHNASDKTPEIETTYKLVIDENVVEKVAALSVQKLSGIIDMKGSLITTIQEGLGGHATSKGVNAEVVNDTGADIELNVILEYGKSAPQVFEEIKSVVSKDLKRMTGLDVREMTVYVVDVMTQDEFSQKNLDTTSR